MFNMCAKQLGYCSFGSSQNIDIKEQYKIWFTSFGGQSTIV